MIRWKPSAVWSVPLWQSPIWTSARRTPPLNACMTYGNVAKFLCERRGALQKLWGMLAVALLPDASVWALSYLGRDA